MAAPTPGTGPPPVVLDTQAVLDWLVFDDPGMRALATAIGQGQVRWLVCPAMRRELAEVLARPALSRRAGACELVLARHDQHAQACPAAPPAGPGLVCSDADDQIFVDLAVAHGARWLVSRDRAVLRLATALRRRGVVVTRPAEWLP